MNGLSLNVENGWLYPANYKGFVCTESMKNSGTIRVCQILTLSFLDFI
jgi:hypothetical protein